LPLPGNRKPMNLDRLQTFFQTSPAAKLLLAALLGGE
jgi:hypothetical protein